MNKSIDLIYYSDVLCIWSYISQIRLDELRDKHGDVVRIEHRFVNVFGNTQKRIGEGWQDKGGFDAFALKMEKTIAKFPHVSLHADVWRHCRPHSSMPAHVFIKAVQLLEREGDISGEIKSSGKTLLEELVWRIRCAFFLEAQDIGQLPVLKTIADELALPVSAIGRHLDDGSAMAAMARDLECKDELKVEGSPTYILNEGRQKLFGNVGYRVIDANVAELLQNPDNQASWC